MAALPRIAHHARARARRREMREGSTVADLRRVASRARGYGYAEAPAIPGRSSMGKAALVAALEAREDDMRRDRANWVAYAHDDRH